MQCQPRTGVGPQVRRPCQRQVTPRILSQQFESRQVVQPDGGVVLAQPRGRIALSQGPLLTQHGQRPEAKCLRDAVGISQKVEFQACRKEESSLILGLGVTPSSGVYGELSAARTNALNV